MPKFRQIWSHCQPAKCVAAAAAFKHSIYVLLKRPAQLTKMFDDEIEFSKNGFSNIQSLSLSLSISSNMHQNQSSEGISSLMEKARPICEEVEDDVEADRTNKQN